MFFREFKYMLLSSLRSRETHFLDAVISFCNDHIYVYGVWRYL